MPAPNVATAAPSWCAATIQPNMIPDRSRPNASAVEFDRWRHRGDPVESVKHRKRSQPPRRVDQPKREIDQGEPLWRP